MKNKEFDQLIKNSLEGFSEVPSGNLGKALDRKMFFNNIWIFHKKKALIIFLFVGGATLFLWDSTIKDDSGLITSNQEIVESNPILKNKNNESNSLGLKENKLNVSNSKDSEISEINTEKVNAVINKVNNLPKSINKSQKKSKIIKGSHVNRKDNKASNSINKNSSLNNRALVINNLSVDLDENIKPSNEDLILRKNAKHITFEFEKNIVNFESQKKLTDDYVIERKGNFSIDAYITPYNQTKISNRLNNKYAKNWWDFYKENKYVNSKLEAGIRVNYDWNNIIASSGVQYERLVEYTPKYIYEKNDDELLLSLLDISEVSGVQVNGVDSAHYIFYVNQNDELITSIEENKYNSFNYISIPLKLGYEFEVSKFSVIIQGGIVYNRLVGAKGNYLRRYQNKENIDIYYNQGIEMALLTRNNSMLKPSYLSFLGTVIGNAKISPSLDLFGEFTCSKSQNSITEDDYFNDKKLINFGTNFGVKYYLQPRLSKQKVEQQMF